jgi:endonuclease/exonuclease/phosphatase family metal-dependent hydrolase
MAGMSSGKKKGGFRFIRYFFIFINLIIALALIASYFSPYVSPEKNSYLPFFGLAYPLLVVANLVFVVLWLFFKARYSLLSLIVILAGFMQIKSHLQISKNHSFSENEFPIKVFSYNVKNFDLYNYTKDWKPQFEKRNQIFSLVKNESPDIICFQEFVNDLSGEFKTKDTLVKFLTAKNVHFEYTVVSKEIIQFGIATFTKYPIVGQGRLDFNNSSTNLCIFTDVLIGKDTVRIYNAHFESIHFDKKDYEYASEVTSLTDLDQHKGGSKRILSLLKAAFVDRASQVEKVADHIGKCHYPVIFCTDLNDTPSSYAYHQISKKLEDAFIESGNGFGNTYAGIFPSFRIDFIFHSKEFSSYNYSTLKVNYSDHYPVSCDMVKKY